MKGMAGRMFGFKKEGIKKNGEKIAKKSFSF